MLLQQEYHLDREQCFCCYGMSGKIYDITPSAVHIKMSDGRVRSYAEIANTVRHPEIADKMKHPFAYVFIDNEVKQCQSKMLEFIDAYEW